MKLMTYLLFITLFAGFINTLSAQTPEYKSYNWDSIPKLHQLGTSDQVLAELVLNETHIIEYVLNDNAFLCYKLIHKTIKVNSDEAIERNNRIYLPLSSNAKLLVNRARVINSKGQVKELKDTDIKEGVNEETKTTYRYFALEGVDKSSEIEYLMVIGKNADYHGEQAVLQGDVPKRNVEFKVVTPENLIFKTKSYNGLPEPKKSTTPEGKNVLTVNVDTIPAIKEELFALYVPNLMQIVYKLDENTGTGQRNLINYIEASQTIYELTHESPDKMPAKELQKLIKQMDISNLTSLEDKIREVENYIKTNFTVDEYSNYKDLGSIIEFKSSDEVGITKLYASILDQLQINYQVVLTSNRFSTKFDPKFEAYNFLVAYLIYFPGLNQFMCPASLSHRLNCIPYGYMNNYGLFVKNVTLGDFKNGLGEIGFIEADSFSRNRHDIIVRADFSKSFEDPDLNYNIIFTGQYAQGIQPLYSYMPRDRQDELNNTILKSILKDAKFTDIHIENEGAEYLAVEPFIIKAKFNSPGIVEQAGEKYLFKIGELIGPQVELYQEEERKFDVENDYNRSYYREITFDVPKGYKANNLESLKMNVSLIENEGASCYFKSDYSIIDYKTVVVKVQEDYKTIYYPKERFQDFRKVVNAAADFNKVVVVFEKE